MFGVVVKGGPALSDSPACLGGYRGPLIYSTRSTSMPASFMCVM